MPSKKVIEQAWEKAHIIRGQNPESWRKDDFGNKIRHASYGTEGEYGWEIDHIRPQSKGGPDNVKNLRPLYWEKNRQKSDKR
jgi:5-methylcytosine-specific restriction endonuclease McrA